MYQTHNMLFLSVFTLLLIYPPHLVALPDDNKAKVFIQADSYLFNYKNGINKYEGHVKVDQGTTHITADRLITKNDDHHKIQEATAYGLQELAHYWTLPKMGEAEIHARAKIIKFYPLESNVTLEQDVQVTQAQNSFQGQLIHYNSNDQTIAVPASQNGRAVIVYDPDK